MEHSFNVAIATEYGVHSAILLNNIYFWIQKSEANKEESHFFDGRYWTYNSKRAFAELFPYLTERQVKFALEKLIEGGILITGNFNKSPMDRTLWYSITDKGYELIGHKCLSHQTNLSNATDENVQAIPNNKHIYNSNINKESDEPTFSGQTNRKPKRDYLVKPIIDVPEENKKLTRQQKQQLKIKELLEIIPKEYSTDLVNVLGEYLEMRINLHIGKIDENWFRKEWEENIYPAIQKYPLTDIIQYIKLTVIPRQYKRCFINIGNSNVVPKFNDLGTYSVEDLSRSASEGKLAIEEAIRNGTFQREF